MDCDVINVMYNYMNIGNNTLPIYQAKLVTTHCYATGNKYAVTLNTPYLYKRNLYLTHGSISRFVVLPTDYADSNREAFTFTIVSFQGWCTRVGIEPTTLRLTVECSTL